MKKYQTNILILTLVLIFSMLGCCKDDPAPHKGKSTVVFNPDKEYGTVTDIDGNEYKTIAIDTQTWMAENLRVTRYSNGDPISYLPLSAGYDIIYYETEGIYCAYDDTADPDSLATYGLLYNGHAVVDQRNLCPDGWHVPSDEEWITLVTYLDNGDNGFDPNGTGTNAVVGGRMKEIGTLHWNAPNPADNSSGFTALPGGCRVGDTFYYKNKMAFFWSSTEYYVDSIPHIEGKMLWMRSISELFATIGRGAFPKDTGQSVRCISDN
ncbi:MAG: fibrobacter succinogenes major paralogous domain-containing protein [Bacteroidales bacterium]